LSLLYRKKEVERHTRKKKKTYFAGSEKALEDLFLVVQEE